MTVMAKVITSAEICENAKMARDMALAGAYQFLFCFQCLRKKFDEIPKLHFFIHSQLLRFSYCFFCYFQEIMMVRAFTMRH